MRLGRLRAPHPLMSYGLEIIEPPEALAATVDEVKARARIDLSHEDHFLEGRIRAAVGVIEPSLGRCLITQKVRLTLDWFPACDDPVIRLPRSPVQSVEAVRYTDRGGDQVELDADDYRVDLSRSIARIEPISKSGWPCTVDQMAAVEVDFIAGYGDAPTDVPAPIRDAIAILVATWHGPGRLAVGTRTDPMPMSVDYLLGPFRVGWYPEG